MRDVDVALRRFLRSLNRDPHLKTMLSKSPHEGILRKVRRALKEEKSAPPLPRPQVFAITDYPLGPFMGPVFEAHRSYAAASGTTVPREGDARRYAFVLSLLTSSDSFMDIGIGSGAFVNAVYSTGMMSRVAGMDRNRRSDFHQIHEWQFWQHRLQEPIRDEFKADVVTCMECIEHIPDPDFSRAVENLKALANKRLIVTVPFMEYPLAKFHSQRFDLERLHLLFPGATLTLLAKSKTLPWVLVDWKKR